MAIPALSNVGKFRRDSRKGGGFFGDVYRAHDTNLDQPRALKIIRDGAGAAVHAQQLAEAQILITCQHPNIVEVKEADILNVDGANRVCIAYELLDRGSIEDLIQAGRRLAPYESADIVTQALFGLQYLHQKAPMVLHRDIKPGNLLIADNGAIKLSDFGLATVAIGGAAASPMAYWTHRAPEMIGTGLATPQTDIYAMGVTLYRLLNSGFPGPIPSNLNRRISRGEFPDRTVYRPYVPAGLRRICNRAMNVDLARRYRTATDFRQALESLRWIRKWDQASPSSWVGREGVHALSLEAVSQKRSGWRVIYLRDGRRVAGHCRGSIPTEAEALAYVERLIATTCLA